MSRKLISGPSISTYHAEILVQRGAQVVTLLVDLPDWEEEVEIVRGLARRFRARTMGEIVSAMEGLGLVRVTTADMVGDGERNWWQVDDVVEGL